MIRTKYLAPLLLAGSLPSLDDVVRPRDRTKRAGSGAKAEAAGRVALGMKPDIVTRAAVCSWAAEPPVLDGKLDDHCWQRAAVIDRFGSFWTNPKKAISGTFAYLVWDDDALYYAGSMTDAELRSFGTKRNDHLWNGDVFELFLKPSEDRPEYYEFQANPRGGVLFEERHSRKPRQRLLGGFATTPPCWETRPPSS